MQNHFKYILCALLILLTLASCMNMNYKKLITDEIVLKDGNSQTGTILKCDSATIKIKQIDESIRIIPWNAVDTVQGKKLKTLWFGMNLGYYKAPYFSVFRNESMAAENIGLQFKLGLALRGNKLFYFHVSTLPDQPYAVTKCGLGFQRYIGGTTYIGKNTFFVGSELNLMYIKYNNGPQATLEPFTGFERKLNEHMRIHFKLGLQFNMANKNNQTGINTTIGIHFMRRNFKRYYNTLNSEHRLPRK
jgi:hypothetical protein